MRDVIAALLVSCFLVFTAQGPSSQIPGSPASGAPVTNGRDAAPPRDPASAPVTGAAVIRGRVIAADTGEPLRGTQISCGGRRTLTDEEGRFEIAELPPGRYTVSAMKTGYLTLSFGQRRPFEPGRLIELAPGAVFDDASFVLPRASVIAGRVVDRYGEPLTGVVVRAERYRYLDGRRTLVRFAPQLFQYVLVYPSTDDRGEFRLFGLPPGEYVVSASPQGQASAPGSGEEGYGRTYYPGATLAAGAERMVLGVGDQRLDVTIQMIASRTATLSGVAQDANGQPYAGATLSLREAGGASLPDLRPIILGPDGSFSLSGVQPGEYTLNVLGRAIDASERIDRGGLKVVVDGHDVTGLVVRAQPGFPARGWVIGPDGRPPEGLATGSVFVRFDAFPGDADGARSGTSAADWTFEVPGLHGQQSVRAFVSVLSPDWIVRRITHRGQDVTDGTLDFSHGPVEDIVVEVTRAIASLGGTVRDERGVTLRDYVVVVFPDDPARWTPPSRFVRTARPDQYGNFLARPLPPGEYLVVAVEYLEQGQESSPAVLEALGGATASARVSLREGETRRVELRLWEGF